MGIKVAVVILNWNGKKFLEDFLPGVIKHSSGDAEVIVADNDSTDGSVAFLKKHFPEIRIIQNKVNGGFAKGYNDALKHVDADIAGCIRYSLCDAFGNPVKGYTSENCNPRIISGLSVH